MPPEERRAIHAYLSIPSHTKLHESAEEAGVSLSALLEGWAQDITEHGTDDARWKTMVRYARRLDAQRRRRGAS